jgi:lactate dehydrogenase-like 2-hydroxyacid dehydrogenase
MTPEFTQIGGCYVDLDDLLSGADIVTLHCPLTPQTHHLIDAEAIDAMKPGVMIINTGRGALVETRALIKGLKAVGSAMSDSMSTKKRATCSSKICPGRSSRMMSSRAC